MDELFNYQNFKQFFSFRSISYTDATLANIPLISYSFGWLAIFTMVSYRCILNIFNKNDLFYKIQRTGKKEVIILRGVPGIGKNNYILEEELDRDTIFSVVSLDDFFIKENKYLFDRSLLNKAHNWAFEQFNIFTDIGVPRIYISNLNNKKWNYSNYIRSAIKSGYKIKVVELVCNNHQELHYFNKRSVHNIPYSYSKKIYEDWDIDANSIHIEPYLGDHWNQLEGDSLPAFPSINVAELDKQLDNYRNKMIESVEDNVEDNVDESADESVDESADDSTTYNITETKDIVNKVNSENIEEISKRRLYIIKSDLNRELHYLKCGELKGIKKIPVEIMDYSISTI